MSTIGDDFDGMDDDEIMETIKEAVNELLEKGFVEMVGIDENGEWLYRATPAGIEYYKNKFKDGQ